MLLDLVALLAVSLVVALTLEVARIAALLMMLDDLAAAEEDRV